MNNSIGLLFVSLHFFASLRFLSYLLLGCGCVAPSLYLIAPHHEKAPPPAAPPKPLSSEPPLTVENTRGGGFWLKRAG